MIIQIYAFSNAKDAITAANLGVDQIGFVAGDYGKVYGELSLETSASIVNAVSGISTSVALTMSTDIEEIVAMAQFVRPDIVHISTDPFDLDVQAMRDLRIRLGSQPQLMKALPVEGNNSIDLAEAFSTTCDYLLLDTKVYGLPGVGATGKTHDWNISKKIVEKVKCPVILAGGLSSENVLEAIQTVQPWGVDSNTSTNIEGDKVRKDMVRIANFCEAARGNTST